MIKNRIADLRKAAKLSQSQLADAIGATLSMVGKLERGERDLNSGWLEKISTALGCRPVELFVEDERIVAMGEIGADGIVIDDEHGMAMLGVEGFMEADWDDFSVARPRSFATQSHATSLVIPRGTKFVYSFQDATDEPFVGQLAVISSSDVPNGRVLVGFALLGTRPGNFHLIPLGSGPPINDARIKSMIPIKQILLP